MNPKIDELTRRSAKVERDVMQLSFRREENERNIQNLQSQAHQLFGTSDLSEMRLIYQKRTQEEGTQIARVESQILANEEIIKQIKAELEQLDQ